jgi:hypothetical protein
VPRAARFVEDHARDAHRGVKRREAGDDCRMSARRVRDVNDKQHRGRRQGGDVGGGRFPGGSESAVEQAHDAFDDGDVRRLGAVQ